MTSDTLWQRFIYNTAFDDTEMPLLNSRKTTVDYSKKTFEISGLSLYNMTEDSFKDVCISLKNGKFGNIIIINDYRFESSNPIIVRGAKVHMMSFCYLFQKHGFNSIIV